MWWSCFTHLLSENFKHGLDWQGKNEEFLYLLMKLQAKFEALGKNMYDE